MTAGGEGGAVAAPIRVLVADDEPDIVGLLAAIIDAAPDLELAGTAADATQAIALGAHTKADVALVDWMMPGGGGAVAARTLAEEHGIKVLALTAADATQASYDMLTAGAVGFLQKGARRDEIVEAIRTVHRY